MTHPDSLARLGGFHGRIGNVDLTTRVIWYDEHDTTWYRRYGGGGALGAWYLLRAIPALADPLGAGNVLVFASSIVSGVDAPGLSRHAVLAKSPLSAATGESQSASTFAPALKSSGLDALVIHGVADRPVHVVIEDGNVRVVDDAGLWGLETADAHDRLISLYGPGAHTALIGRAGERLVRFASIVNDVRFMNCRTGMGAVMGSKRLKAVVAVAGPPVPFGDSRRAQAAVDAYWADRRSSLFNLLQEDYGTFHWYTGTGRDVTRLGIDPHAPVVTPLAPQLDGLPMPARNWQRAVVTHVDSVANEVLEERYRVDETPPPNLEFAHRYHVRRGPYATDPRYGGAETEHPTGLASLCAIEDPEALLKAIEATYRHGLDPESLGGTIAWAMECAEQGLLASTDFGGPAPVFGDGDAVLALIEKIVRRDGIGDLLAEGSARASATIGRGTEAYAMVARGIELSGHDPRHKPGWALVNVSGPVGPDFQAVEHDWDLSPGVAGSGVEEGLARSRSFGLLDRLPERDDGPGKVRQTIVLQRWWSGALESLLFDYRSIAPMRFMTPHHVEELVGGITGWDVSIHEIMLMGERRIVMLQEFNRRHGLTQQTERYPNRIHEQAIHEGPFLGATLPLSTLRRMQDAYYAMSGWDSQGWPHEWKLQELDIAWIAELGR